MKMKYPDKKLVFLMDNLWAHKSILIMRIMESEKNHIKILLVPSNTPQFSPIGKWFLRKIKSY